MWRLLYKIRDYLKTITLKSSAIRFGGKGGEKGRPEHEPYTRTHDGQGISSADIL